ncbi:MAG: GHKL domain-containing protein [Winogradskyella sp.]|uniref:sensor histidine kinase n=1 Tax=Winogradskyella sp. TaxID=1883156 RepID=UPI0025FBED1D|nr:ATP-binding protein [Winogradskyella sp.]NRB60288.1 GHKL domain-containing protein [Winogradskyella sp.]
MNSLLKRQIRKYLPDGLATDENIQRFLEAVDKSYTNYDEQFTMQQRAMNISSEELFQANKQLRKDTLEQQEVIEKLKHIIETLEVYNLSENKNNDIIDLDGSKLVDFIDNQAKEIVEMNKQQEKLLVELAHQNQELSEYAHMVSHDLKTPLRSIDALTAWLSEDYKDSFDDNGKESISMIRNSVKKMENLITGILEYSTITRSRKDFYDVQLNLVLIEVHSELFVPDHIKINVMDMPIIKGDKYRLKQLFHHLLSNAINAIDKSEGHIEVGYTNKEEDWEFYVKDNGKGIEKRYFNKIFDTFQKLENHLESTGMGLPIVKKILTTYGGKIWVDSQPGNGSTFYFTIKKEPNGRA